VNSGSDQDQLLAEQRAYYSALAPAYLDQGLDLPGGAELMDALDTFRPTGSVLELACGPGVWTRQLLRYASNVTAVDASSEMLAIAAGIVVGRKMGASAQAALTTRGFSELTRLGRACGARSETMAGLSGLGDLILTCSSPQSRNFALGIALGRGEPPPRGKLAEGEFTAPVLIELAASQHVDMPVSNAVAAILSGAMTIDAAIESLLTRPFKAEE